MGVEGLIFELPDAIVDDEGSAIFQIHHNYIVQIPPDRWLGRAERAMTDTIKSFVSHKT